MQTYMARLGSFMFGIDTAAFQELQRVSSYRWGKLNRIGRKPSQQFTGADSDSITLSGSIYPHYAGGLGQVSAMRQMAGTGEPLALIYTSELVGQFLGRWCVKTIEERRTVFFANGAPRKIEFSLTLEEYGEDNAALATMPAAALGSSLSPAAAAAAYDAAKAAYAAANPVATSDDAMAAAPKVAAASKSLVESINDTVNAIKNSRTVSMINKVAGDVRAVTGAADRLKEASAAIEAADGNPTAMIDAMVLAAGAADASVGALGRVTSSVNAGGSMANGGSSQSLLSQQAGELATTLRTLSDSASKISASSKKIRGVL